jgi:signal peptidase I
MNIDFSLVLLVLSAVTGLVWLFDRLFLFRTRSNRVETFLQASKTSIDEFQSYYASLDENGTPAAPGAADRDEAKHKVLQQAFRLYREPLPVEYAKSFFPILFGVLVLRSFLFEPFQIPTGSMIPTLNVGDFIVVSKYSYGVRLPVLGTRIIEVDEPKRGDIMVFIPPHDPNYFIKRVIGLPGDHVRYVDKVIYINGEAIPQDAPELLEEQGILHSMETIGGVKHDIYTAASQQFNRIYDFMPPEGIIVPAGHYFMMGDNRDNSSDSRYWGPVSEDNIVGKAVAVWMQKAPGLHLPSFSENRFIKNPE